MGGLGALIVIVIYLAVAITVVRLLKNKKARYAAIAVFALAPTADAVVGRIYMKHLCATEGGLKVFRSVENVEGFSLGNLSPTGDWVKHFGYRFEEGFLHPNGNVNRYSLVDGRLIRELDVPMRSLYRSQFRNSADEGMIMKSEALVEVIKTGEVLASYTGFYFRGGWAERLLAGFADAGPGTTWSCDEWRPEVFRRQTIIHALKPVK